MSSGAPARQRTPSTGTGSRQSNKSGHSRPPRPPVTLTPDNADQGFAPCAATACFLLYSQRNTILILHHDTLAIERRFELHREEVLWIQVDNASDRGFGRLAVSYDAGHTAIVWDIHTGGEVARFSSYENMRAASFMRNGNITFGNDKGSIILFEPSTSEHIAAKTIFDPVTALAPSFDCRTFAIGYLNGSILITTLQPSFTILHTLTTNRLPAPIAGLAWHGSSSKQKTDMLATQTADGDMRVWSVPKVPHQDLQLTVIRVLQRAELKAPGPVWFAWSKNGRIVQHAEGETRSWDVRTKRVTFEVIPTVDDAVAITNYGPTATLFTLGRNHTIQQYDITPGKESMLVATVQHMPAITPPTPPTDLETSMLANKGRYQSPLSLPTVAPSTETASSTDEASALSPLQKIAQDMDNTDASDSEVRDKVMPLSPSSKASSVSSRSSRDSRRARRYLYDLPDSSRGSSIAGMTSTEFSIGEPVRYSGHDSISIRSVSTYAPRPPHYRSSSLRNQVMRSPEDAFTHSAMDLFPFTKARLRGVDFRTPHYGDGQRTAVLLQREMLSVVFGWNDNVQNLIRDEMEQHRRGSASAVLLAKWLGNVGADSMAAMVGSETMTSSDWMLLALSSIGKDSQKTVGEAFVQRLLEKGDIHPAVAILLGLGEHNDAIEVYVSQAYFMEALLLSCLHFPNDWSRSVFLLRKWGEQATKEGQAELAVRCFSCAASETSGMWVSPRAQQEAAWAAQKQGKGEPASAGVATSPPISPPSRSGSLKFQARNANLKLITSFGDKGMLTAPANPQIGATPIAESAITPGGWQQPRQRTYRDPSSARTATPGGFGRRKRLPSKSDLERAKQDAMDMELVTPMTASQEYAPALLPIRPRSRTSEAGSLPEPATALRTTTYNSEKLFSRPEDRERLPSPVHNLTDRLRAGSREAAERKIGPLAVQIMETRFTDQPSAGSKQFEGLNILRDAGRDSSNRVAATSPSLTDRSGKTRAIDDYINSVEEARNRARRDRAHSRKRGESRKREDSRSGRERSRARDASAAHGRDNVRYIKPSKRSPASPLPMSPEEIAQAGLKAKSEPATTDDEEFYKLASPVATTNDGVRSLTISSNETRQARPVRREASRNRRKSPSADGRGRTNERKLGSLARSPSLPLPVSPEKRASAETDDTESDGRRMRIRAASSGRKPEDLQTRRAASSESRSKSADRLGHTRNKESVAFVLPELESVQEGAAEEQESVSSLSNASDTRRRPAGMSRKELAAKELEERRLSLARRPSAPQIPFPGASHPPPIRPGMAPRAHTDLGDSPSTSHPPLLGQSNNMNPEIYVRAMFPTRTGVNMPPMGLPATPKAMRTPRTPGGADEQEAIPRVPGLLVAYSDIASSVDTGAASSLSTGTESNIESNISGLSSVFAAQHSHLTQATHISTSQPGLFSARQSTISNGPSDLSSAPSGFKSSDASKGTIESEPILPSYVFGQPIAPPPRSASVPSEKKSDVHPAYKPDLPHTRRLSQMQNRARKLSPPERSPTAIREDDDGPQQDEQVIILAESSLVSDVSEPPLLPELQHLAGPPAPPPIPTMFSPTSHVGSEVESLSVDTSSASTSEVSSTRSKTKGSSTRYPTSAAPTYPHPMNRASTSSPVAVHRSRGSVSESFGSRIRGVTERMRSQSRSRGAKSPTNATPVPYESIPPPMPSHLARRESLSAVNRANSPYEQAMAGTQEQLSVPPMSPASQEKLNETSMPPSNLPSSLSGSTNGYRNPKEIRANMPPETLQQGVFDGGFL